MKKAISIADLAEVDIETVSKGELVDLNTVPLDITIPQEERTDYLFKMLKNPYCFRVGDVVVELEFTNNGPPLKEIFTDFLIRKKSE